MDAVEDPIYIIVANIPSFYRSSNLRNFFSQFVEQGGFDCFHYRHRPQFPPDGDRHKSSSTTLNSDNLKDSTDREHCEKVDQNKDTSSRNFSMSKLGARKCSKVKNKCCVIRMYKSKFVQFCSMYHGKLWLDENDDPLPIRCHIKKLKLCCGENARSPSVLESQSIELNGSNTKSNDTARINSLPYLNSMDRRKLKKLRHEFLPSDLRNISELNPPHIMPNGNVGTKTSHFADLIRDCLMPTSVLKKLGLIFLKKSGNRLYSAVPFDYHLDVFSGTTCPNVRTANNTVLTTEYVQKSRRTFQEVPESNQLLDEDEEEEEWDRHCALHDNCDKSERNKQRLFEEDLEVVWEKGGSGLVFYTDAQYWDEFEGDFDERTTDDWDIDYGAFYEDNGGDKDACDFLEMRQETRSRNGIETPENKGVTHKGRNLEGGVRVFKNYTKGIGRKVMERQGWLEGQALGQSNGITEALSNYGQHPTDKSGIGYHGEKLPLYTSNRKRLRETYIGTKYDDASELVLAETLKQRAHPHEMKYRK